jgi:hypothetical protein
MHAHVLFGRESQPRTRLTSNTYAKMSLVHGVRLCGLVHRKVAYGMLS